MFSRLKRFLRGDTQTLEDGTPGVVSYHEDDARMRFAIEEAQQSLRVFFDALVSPNPNQTGFLLKVHFEEDGESEHVWMADIDPSVMPLVGTVANETSLSRVEFMSRVSFGPEQITDWMYIEDGYLVGGYTTQVIRSAMTPEARAGHDRHAPYKFRD